MEVRSIRTQGDTVPEPSRRSWWLREALASEERPLPALTMQGDVRSDVAVVGGGYTGLWTALALKSADPSVQVAVIEAGIVGDGASGRNGGVSQGYWVSLDSLRRVMPRDDAVHLCKLADGFVPALRSLATQYGRNVWMRQDGYLKVSCSPAQDRILQASVEAISATGIPDVVRPVPGSELPKWIKSPAFRQGAYFRDGLTVQPARVARLLRTACLDRGVHLFEHTPVGNIRPEQDRVNIYTAKGQIVADCAVVATNAWAARYRQVRRHITNFGSYVVLTEPVPELLGKIGWSSGLAVTDCRMFLHYFRTTNDARVLMGSASGPIGFSGRVDDRFFLDRDTVGRAAEGLRRLLPALKDVRLTDAWGGPVDVSADHWPFIGRLGGGSLYFAGGYSGQGICQSWMLAQALSARILARDSAWSDVRWLWRTPPRMPPEPFRRIGGGAVRSAILNCETNEDSGRPVRTIDRVVASLPRWLRMELGTR